MEPPVSNRPAVRPEVRTCCAFGICMLDCFTEDSSRYMNGNGNVNLQFVKVR